MEKERFHQLLAKKISSNISDVEAAELQQAISNEAIYGEVDHKLTAYLENSEKEEASSDMLAKIWREIEKGEHSTPVKVDHAILKDKRGFKFRVLKIAAVLLFVTSIALIYYQFIHIQNKAFVAVSTTNHKTSLVLNDGTRVWLNKESEISYNQNFGKDKREIFLKGEAYFDVVKNQEVPLVVHAGEIDVKVKGTSFNVNARRKRKEIEVILVSGLVEVAKKRERNPVVLHPNQKLVFSPQPTNPNGGQFVILSMPAHAMIQEVGWKNDTLHFHKEKLKDLALKLEKRYQVKITITSAQLKERRFTGSLVNSSIQEVLEVLKLTCSCGLNYSINNNLIVIKD